MISVCSARALSEFLSVIFVNTQNLSLMEITLSALIAEQCKIPRESIWRVLVQSRTHIRNRPSDREFPRFFATTRKGAIVSGDLPERPRIFRATENFPHDREFSRATKNHPRERMTSSKKVADISENLGEGCTHAHCESLSSWLSGN